MAKKKKKVVKKKTKVSKKKAPAKKNLKKKNTKVKSNKNSKHKIVKKTKKTVVKKVSKKSELKTLTEDKPKKIPKAISGFEDKIKEIFAKLINKYKVDGIYTKKIIEKAIPKKLRLDENIEKFENFIKSNNIKIYTEEEAQELVLLAKEQENKSEDNNIDGEIIHKGISQRQFARSFTIADDVKVSGAELKDGLLTISCERIVPEHKKKKLIEIK